MQQFEICSASLIWDGQARVVEVDATHTEPLIGMGLLYGYELRIQGIAGGTITIEALQ